MRKIYFLIVGMFLLNTASAQRDSTYRIGLEGMQYKIIANGKGDLLNKGQFMELHFTNVLSDPERKDSILMSTREQGAPQIMEYDSSQIPPAYFKIFSEMRNGDSLNVKTSVDSLLKKNTGELPAFMKKGMFVYTNVKITNIYKTKEAADVAKEENNIIAEKITVEKAATLKILDDEMLANYIQEKNIIATKTKNGVYIETLKEGLGVKLDSNIFVKVNYTGKTINGVMFDSNTDPAKGHLVPLLVNLTNDLSLGNGVIPGMSEGLKMMKKGSKGNLYIPSGLGYGARGAGSEIPPNAILIFEVEVLSIVTKNKAKSEAIALQQKMMLEQRAMQAKQFKAQKRYMDSLQKADPIKAAALKKDMIEVAPEEDQSKNEIKKSSGNVRKSTKRGNPINKRKKK